MKKTMQQASEGKLQQASEENNATSF